MAFVYTAWPTINDVMTLAGTVPNVDPTPVQPMITQAILDAVSREIQQKTKRQFVASAAGVVRYFDGSGTGEQIIDEYVTITAINLVSFSGATPITLENYYAEDDNLYPKTRLAIFQGGPPSYGLGYYSIFPAGRKNIGVTATWGYGATIPADLWMAHMEESSARLSALVVANPEGRLQQVTVADAISEKYELKMPGEATGWHERFGETVHCYVNPKVHTPPSRKAIMI